MQYANRRNRKGRTMGGIAMGTRVGIERREDERENKEERLMEVNVKLGEEWWRIVGVYVNNNIERTLEILKR